ncbi:MAG: prepilin-type N-terminal cleavage/methylation domain-containing protein [Rhodospirillaceae bacterium]
MSKRNLTSRAGQKGFTLIEMSIVLVIIGLIIGGILKGQEVIESSRQKNLITQIDATRAALTTFGDRYRAIPGDWNCAEVNGAICVGRLSATDAAHLNNGNGNGIVGATVAAGVANIAGAVAASIAANAENVQFCVHMAADNLIGGTTLTAAAATGFGEGQPLPSTSLPNAGMSVVHGNYNDLATAARLTHWLRVHRTVAGGGAALTGKQMFEIDLKIDDTLPASGQFRSGIEAATCGTAANAAYTASSEVLACTALIDLIQ